MSHSLGIAIESLNPEQYDDVSASQGHNQQIQTPTDHVRQIARRRQDLSFIKTSYTRNINDLAPSSIGNVPVRF